MLLLLLFHVVVVVSCCCFCCCCQCAYLFTTTVDDFTISPSLLRVLHLVIKCLSSGMVNVLLLGLEMNL